jgi:hypothetical protein
MSHISSKENKAKLECNYICGTTDEMGKKAVFCRGGKSRDLCRVVTSLSLFKALHVGLVLPLFVLRSFALTPFTNLHHFLIYALSFSV